jgi:putative membrane protein
LTVIFGLWLLLDYAWIAYANMGWLHAKLLLAFLLIVYHVYCWQYLQDFKYDRNHHSHVFYRWFNEFPVLILVGITLLVIVKPF